MDLYNNYQEPISCKAELQTNELWQQFHELDTEMIITKSGRRMFPALRVQLSHLDPEAYYCVLLELSPVGGHKQKWSPAGGGAWAPAGALDLQSPRRLYLHPDGPAKGKHWMYTAVSFGRVKLTNTLNAPSGHLVLASMHRYQPRIVLVQTSNTRGLSLMGYAALPHRAIVFPETAFIAVTAYQNDKITKLKIDNNPFAKGFRDNGQSKCKRKRQSGNTVTDISQQQETTVTAIDNHTESSFNIDIDVETVSSSSNNLDNNNTSSSEDSNSSSLRLLAADSSTTSHDCQQCQTVVTSPYCHILPATLDVYNAAYYNSLSQLTYMQSHQPNFSYSSYHMYYNTPSVAIARALPEDLSLNNIDNEAKKPKKLTDFSIKAITGLS